jgi:hypothetical protein
MKMNNIKIIQKKVPLLFLLVSILTFFSCEDKMDSYKKYIEGGEISYTGKIEDVVLHPGDKRILLTGLLKSDPKIEKAKVFWNGMKDSVEIDINRSAGVDTVQIMLENMSENIYNFTFFTYDGDGNSSIPVNESGAVYGDRYRLTLLDRLVKSTYNTDSGLYVMMGETSYLKNLVYSELNYIDNSDKEFTILVPPLSETNDDGVDSVFLPNYKQDSRLTTRNYFLPDSLAIDTFATDIKELVLREDITANYMLNTASPFAYSDWDGTRYGNLADWVSNDSVKNHNGYGGYILYSPGNGLISVDAGFGVPAVSNGKIYQTITLPAGDYVFEIDFQKNSVAGTKYVAAAIGDSLPDIVDVETSTLAHADIGGGVLEFSLSQTETISLGFLFDLPGDGDEHCRISEVKLYLLQ